MTGQLSAACDYNSRVAEYLTDYLRGLGHDPFPEAAQVVLALSMVAQVQQVLDGLEAMDMPSRGDSTTQAAPSDHSDAAAPAQGTPPAAVESGPCISCGEYTTETDCEQFLCVTCRRKGVW